MRNPQVWILLAAFAALGFVLWFGGANEGPVFCFSQRVWGIACPSCGMGRALHALLHFHIGEAVYFNPLAIPAFLYGAALASVSAYDLLKETDQTRKWLHFRISIPMALALSAIVGLIWMRNLSLY